MWWRAVPASKIVRPPPFMLIRYTADERGVPDQKEGGEKGVGWDYSREHAERAIEAKNSRQTQN